MKCLVGFQKHLLVKPVTTEGFITRSEKMLFPRKPLSKSTFILLFIPRHGIYYGLKISTGECPVLEPSQWPAPEETKRGNAESYTGTMVPKQERNVCARRRGSCMELRHTETSVWHFHQYSTSPFARRLLISAYQCHWEAMAAWLYVCNPVELHWRTAVGSVPPAQRHSEPRGILRCRDLATALPSAMAGGGESPPGSQHLAGNLAVLLHLGCGVQAPALLLPSLRAGFCAGLQESRGAALAPGFSAPACSSRAGQALSSRVLLRASGGEGTALTHSSTAGSHQGEQPRDMQRSCPGQKAKAGEAEV